MRAGMQATTGRREELLGPHVRVLLVSDVPSSHRRAHVLCKSGAVLAEVLGGFCAGEGDG